MHITLTGNLGSGKSTYCALLASMYGYEVYSTGTVQRRLAEELGLSVLEMNKKMCADHSFDHVIDDTTVRISKENVDKNLVFDSRLAWHFVEKSFKVFVSVNIDEAARRVWNANRGFVEKYTSVEDAKKQLIQRAQTEDLRYKELYQINYFDFNNYNLVLDSTYIAPEELTQLIIKEATQYETKEGYYADHTTKILMSPYRLGLSRNETIAISDLNELYDPDSQITVVKDGDNYKVVGNVEEALRISKEGYPLVLISIQ